MLSKIFALGLCLPILASAYIVGLFERDFVNLPGYKVAQAQSLYIDIGHRFLTPLEEDGKWSNIYKELLGADGSANITLNAAYGIGNLMDVKFSRYSYSKLYMLSTRINLFNQPIDKLPMSLSFDFNYGIRTQENPGWQGYSPYTYGASATLCRDFFGEKFFITGVGAYQVGTDATKNALNENPHGYTVSLGSNVGVRLDRVTLALEYIRPMGGFMREVDGLIMDNFGIALRYRIYKHLFSITFNNHAMNSPDGLAGGSDHQQSKTDVRFGFNIIRQIGGY